MSNHFLSAGMLVLALLTNAGGNVLTAAFCPRALGRECCFDKTRNHTSPSIHENMAVHDMHMHGMSMAGMKMEDTAMDAPSIAGMAMNDMMIDAATVDIVIPLSPPPSSDESVANQFGQPVDSCAHCLGHSGTFNAPVSFVRVSDQSGKEIPSVPMPVSKCFIRPALALAQIGLPKEHAPPGTRASRHILISVFLI